MELLPIYGHEQFRAAGLLDVALRSTGSCCSADREVGWCCPWYQSHMCQLRDTVCSQLLGAHALSRCVTVSYSFRKGNTSVLMTPKAGNFQRLFDMLGEERATRVDLMVVGEHVFAVLYAQPTDNSMTQAWYILYTRKQRSRCSSCYCLRHTHTFTSTCDMLTWRRYLGRQLTKMFFQMSPYQSMAAKYMIG